ncbi:MAG: MAPEG family protein [Myxococcales bacterium]|nr:MAPEG family protein [Myxococcales bacterium]
MKEAYLAYGVTTLVLCLNLTLLWIASGAARTKTKQTLNPEDAQTVMKGADVVDSDPDAVARVLRAHTNTLANTVPFLFIGQVYVAAGVDAMMAWIFMGTFAAARVLYSVCYLRGIQPWRTVTFGIGMLATLGMLVHAGILLL